MRPVREESAEMLVIWLFERFRYMRSIRPESGVRSDIWLFWMYRVTRSVQYSMPVRSLIIRWWAERFVRPMRSVSRISPDGLPMASRMAASSPGSGKLTTVSAFTGQTVRRIAKAERKARIRALLLARP